MRADPFAGVDYDQRNVQHEERALPASVQVAHAPARRLSGRQVRAIAEEIAAHHGARIVETATEGVFLVDLPTGHVRVRVAALPECCIFAGAGDDGRTAMVGWALRQAFRSALRRPESDAWKAVPQMADPYPLTKEVSS